MPFSNKITGFALALAAAAAPLAAGNTGSGLRTKAKALGVALLLAGAEAIRAETAPVDLPLPIDENRTDLTAMGWEPRVRASAALEAYRAEVYPTELLRPGRAAGIPIGSVLGQFETVDEITRNGWQAAQAVRSEGGTAAPLASIRACRLTLELDHEVLAALEVVAGDRADAGPRVMRRRLQVIELLRLGLDHEIAGNEKQIRQFAGRLLKAAKVRARMGLLQACNELMNGALQRLEGHAAVLLAEAGEEPAAPCCEQPAGRAFPEEDSRLPGSR